MKKLSKVDEKNLKDFYKTVSQNVRTIRKQRNKPQLDLVLDMGLRSISFYSKCENLKDNHHFNLEHIYKIAVALNVDISEFFNGINTINEDP